MRLYALLLDALSRCRGKAPSEQKVTVEYVHVHAGAEVKQAVCHSIRMTGQLELRAEVCESGGLRPGVRDSLP